MMSKKLRFRIVLSIVAIGVCIGFSWAVMQPEAVAVSKGDTGILERLVAVDGNVTMNIDVNRLNGTRSRTRTRDLRFDVSSDAFFTSLVFNDEFRGTLPGTMKLAPQNYVSVPEKLRASHNQLVIESLAWGGPYELVVRDGESGFVFFNIEGHEYTYDVANRTLGIRSGRLLISDEFAAELGRTSDAGTIVGKIDISTEMSQVEVTHIMDGETTKSVLPPMNNPETGTVPGPDVVVGDLIGLAQFGSSVGTQVGLAVGTDSCNFGTMNLNWFANPSNDHPVIPQNLYRMSGGPNNDERFEQIGQSQVKHAFTALTQNICNLGCNGVGGTQLGSGCSDPYSASLNSGPNLGSKAWINPFTGFYPRNDSATPNNSHTGHTHSGPTHRVLTEIADLSTSQNPGATYYAEAQYVTPHEYTHCQSNPTQCNMYNNVSYRRYNVTGTASPFTFSAAASTVRMKAAIEAWTGATIVPFQPAPGVDGVAMIGYKITNPSAGVWHYEYAVYNQNLDRAIQSFSIPIGNGVTLSNIGFRMPPQHPGSTADGTFNNAGFSSSPWTQNQSPTEITWNSDTLAQNQNANAIRWGTMYNFRFDSNRPPVAALATVGFFKTGSPMTVSVQGPSAAVASNVFITGRVLTSSGQGVSGAKVALNNASGALITTATTNSFGVYRFDNVPSGLTYIIDVPSKRYNFPVRTVTVSDNLSDFNFVDQSGQ